MLFRSITADRRIVRRIRARSLVADRWDHRRTRVGLAHWTFVPLRSPLPSLESERLRVVAGKNDGFCRSRQNVSQITERRYRRYGYRRWKSQTRRQPMLQSSFTEVMQSRAARLSVLHINHCFDDPGGQTLLGRLGAGCGEQRRDLRDRSSNQAIRICSCQSFLSCPLRGKPPHLAQGGTLVPRQRLLQFEQSPKKQKAGCASPPFSQV